MIHFLTVGHLDAEALRQCEGMATRPLDETTVRRVLAEFPGIKAEHKDGYMVLPWHNLGPVGYQRSIRPPTPRTDRLLNRRPAKRASHRAGGIVG